MQLFDYQMFFFSLEPVNIGIQINLKCKEVYFASFFKAFLHLLYIKLFFPLNVLALCLVHWLQVSSPSFIHSTTRVSVSFFSLVYSFHLAICIFATISTSSFFILSLLCKDEPAKQSDIFFLICLLRLYHLLWHSCDNDSSTKFHINVCCM